MSRCEGGAPPASAAGYPAEHPVDLQQPCHPRSSLADPKHVPPHTSHAQPAPCQHETRNLPCTTSDAFSLRFDGFSNSYADLAVYPRDRPNNERLVLDCDISAGWLHSGYPVGCGGLHSRL